MKNVSVWLLPGLLTLILGACAQPIVSLPDRETLVATPYTSNLIGFEVTNGRETKFGHITDVIIKPESGQITYLVLAFDRSLPDKAAFLGTRAEYVLIPWSAVNLATQQETVIVKIDLNTMALAPDFDQIPRLLTPQQEAEIDQYWQRVIGRETNNDKM
jgi:sporulation protein YlmC with PRC-barrel domain